MNPEEEPEEWCRVLTSSEEDDGFQAGEFSGIHMDRLKPDEDIGQNAHLSSGVSVFAVLVQVEEWTGRNVQGHAPLDGVQEKQLAPGFFQQDNLQLEIEAHILQPEENTRALPDL